MLVKYQQHAEHMLTTKKVLALFFNAFVCKNFEMTPIPQKVFCRNTVDHPAAKNQVIEV